MMDWPERLLRVAVRQMPAGRRDWGAAMLAELTCVEGGRERWHFAAGCARTALGGEMNAQVRRVRGVILISLMWAPVWALMLGALVQALELLIGPNNEPSLAFMMWIAGQVGLVSGACFGVLMAVGENGKPVGGLSLLRAAMWGSVSSAVFPVVTGRADQMFWTCTFGVIVAVGLVALARRAARAQAGGAAGFALACALMPVEDVVNRRQERTA